MTYPDVIDPVSVHELPPLNKVSFTVWDTHFPGRVYNPCGRIYNLRGFWRFICSWTSKMQPTVHHPI